MFDGNLTLDQIMSIPAPGPGEAGNAPQWSPDGSRILFVSSLGGSPDIWSISPQGGFPSRVTLGLGTADYAASHMPLWSPHGRHISYISNKSGANEVWLWHSSGDPESQLTNLGLTSNPCAGRRMARAWSCLATATVATTSTESICPLGTLHDLPRIPSMK